MSAEEVIWDTMNEPNQSLFIVLCKPWVNPISAVIIWVILQIDGYGIQNPIPIQNYNCFAFPMQVGEFPLLEIG